MRTRTLLLAVAVAMLPMASSGAVSELSQSQLRALVSQGNVISAQAVVHGVSSNFGGRVLEIRAFTTDNGVAYRVLLQQSGGAMGEVMVDGMTGHQIMQGTSLGSEISKTARTTNQTAAVSVRANGNASTPGNDRSRSVRNANASERSNNASSNSNGRSNNGNGNSGGNGNGNSGGNGKGRNK